MKQLLILEPDTEGHPQEWLQHLAEYVANNEAAPAIWVAVAPAMCQRLSKAMPISPPGRIRYISLTPRELKWCTHRSLVVEGFARWWTMRRYLARTQADAGFYLALDLLCIPLALAAHDKPVAGVIFRPSVHYASLGMHKPGFKERLRDLRKDILYRLMLRNNVAILSLDQYFPAYAKRHYPQGNKVHFVSEPIGLGRPQAGETKLTWPVPGRTSFLLFGHLTERKGSLVVLDALRLLPHNIAKQVAVLFAGRVDEAIRHRLDEGRRRLAEENPQVWLHVEDRRLDQAELDLLIARSAVILAPYQRFVGSSGVLIWAARAGRPVLAQDYGLVGKLTRDHKLGAVADSSDPEQLAAKIVQMVRQGPKTFIDPVAAQSYVAAHTLQHFAETILGMNGGKK